MKPLDQVAREVLHDCPLSSGLYFSFEYLHNFCEQATLVPIALLILGGNGRFEGMTFWITFCGILLSPVIRVVCNLVLFLRTNTGEELASYAKYWKERGGQSLFTLTMPRCVVGIACIFQKVALDATNTSPFFLILNITCLPIVVCTVLVLTIVEGAVGLVVFLLLVFPGHPVAVLFSRIARRELPEWYQRYIFLYKLLAAERSLQFKEQFAVFGLISSSKSMTLMTNELGTSVWTGYVPINYFHFALGALALSRFEEITDSDKLKFFYESLKKGNLAGGGIRHVIVKPPEKEDQEHCLTECAAGNLMLNATKLEELRATGLRFYAVGSCSKQGSFLSWFRATLSPTELITSEVLFAALRRRTLFVSHRWDSTGTWNGRDSWQLREVFDYMAMCPANEEGHKLEYFWMDGLSVPQEHSTNEGNASLTMLVISHLATLVRRCDRFLIIDRVKNPTKARGQGGMDAADFYNQRTWCQFELYLARNLKPVTISTNSVGESQDLAAVTVDADHDFIHRLMASSACHMEDKLFILQTIFFTTPAAYPDVTYRPMFEIFESFWRFQAYMRARRFKAVPASKIVALNLITTYLGRLAKALEGGAQHDAVPVIRSCFLPKDVRNILEGASMLVDGMGCSKIFTAKELVSLPFVYAADLHPAPSPSASEWCPACTLYLGVFGLTAKAICSMHPEKREFRVVFEHCPYVMEQDEFEEVQIKMEDGEIATTKEDMLRLPWSEFPIVDVYDEIDPPQQPAPAAAKGFHLRRTARFSDTTSRWLMLLTVLFWMPFAALWMHFFLVLPVADWAALDGAGLNASCAVAAAGCWHRAHTHSMFGGRHSAWTCAVNVTLDGGGGAPSWAAVAEQYGTASGLPGSGGGEVPPLRAPSGAAVSGAPGDELRCAYRPGAAAGACTAPLGLCAEVSLGEGVPGALGTAAAVARWVAWGALPAVVLLYLATFDLPPSSCFGGGGRRKKRCRRPGKEAGSESLGAAQVAPSLPS